jgi:hypothetical protein
MPTFFTLYITNKTIDEKYRRYVGLVDSWSSNPTLNKLNVGVGDSIYWVSIKEGSLYVISGLRFGRILSYEDFSKQYGKDLADAWGGHGKSFYVASEATTIAVHRKVSLEDAKNIRFETGKDRLKFKKDSNDLDPQTLRSPRELTMESARLLDGYLGDYVQIEDKHITAWRKYFESIPTNLTETYSVHNQESESGYIPTHEDYDNTRRKCLREDKKSMSIVNIMDIMQNDLEGVGCQLDESWRSVTEENIRVWIVKE